MHCLCGPDMPLHTAECAAYTSYISFTLARPFGFQCALWHACCSHVCEQQVAPSTAPTHHHSNGLQPWHCPVQVRSEDVRVFVEVLQSLHPEPADMVQLRASEAQLRGRVAKLQADMDGHHLQQTIKHCQQAEARHNLLASFAAMPMPKALFCCRLGDSKCKQSTVACTLKLCCKSQPCG